MAVATEAGSHRLQALGLTGRVGPLVDGAPLAWAGEWLPVEDPATGEMLCEVADSGAEAVDAAVGAARAVYDAELRALPEVERARRLGRAAALIRERADDLALVETLDTGKALSQSHADVETAARYFEFYGGVADKLGGETIPAGPGVLAYTVREPYGVVGHVIPWNSPLSQLARGVAPSLACGNAVVVKPSELAPLSSLLAARLLAEAGFPPAAVNVVPGRGETAGAALVAHRGVGAITFTGSVPNGRAVLRAAAEAITPCHLELGGKSPTIILPDADLAAAARAGLNALVRNSGQSCFATTRLIVHRSVHDELVERLCSAAAELTLGPGLEDPDVGPLVSAAQAAKVLELVAGAVAEGATVAVGGKRPEHARLARGHFVTPTVMVGLGNHTRIAQEEIFGPVQCVLAYDAEDEAVALANDTRYGLAAGVFTRDFATAHRLARRLEAGQVQINQYPLGGVETPFGGYKESGMGREKGLAALDHYAQLKTVIARVEPA